MKNYINTNQVSYQDILNELSNYKTYFRDKIVLCNYDESSDNNLFKVLSDNFENFRLKKLRAIACTQDNKSVHYLYDKDGLHEPVVEDYSGDFREHYNQIRLEMSDIVIGFPKLNLFNEYVSNLLKYDKKFLVLGDKRNIEVDMIFKRISNNEMRIGHTSPKMFDIKETSGHKYAGNCYRWFTNLPVLSKENLVLSERYNKKDYTFIDNTNILNVDKCKNIPVDYDGLMAVPMTFIDKWSPKLKCKNTMLTEKIVTANDFDIITILNVRNPKTSIIRPVVNGVKLTGSRVVIQRK